MLAPALTQEWFDKCFAEGLCTHKSISKYNAKNCKQEFSKTIPKALRDEEWNAFLIIKNHKGRWKYMGFQVENVAGALHIIDNPEIMWTGYVFHERSWYAVDAQDLIKGRIPASSKIILPQIEHEEN